MSQTTRTSDDALLVSDYLNGNEWALEKLINRHQQRIFNFIYSKVHCRDTTEDIFQDTFIKVIKTLKNGQYNEEGKFLPWVMRIAHNLVIDHFRKNNRIPKFESSDDFDIFQFQLLYFDLYFLKQALLSAFQELQYLLYKNLIFYSIPYVQHVIRIIQLLYSYLFI